MFKKIKIMTAKTQGNAQDLLTETLPRDCFPANGVRNAEHLLVRLFRETS